MPWVPTSMPRTYRPRAAIAGGRAAAAAAVVVLAAMAVAAGRDEVDGEYVEARAERRLAMGARVSTSIADINGVYFHGHRVPIFDDRHLAPRHRRKMRVQVLHPVSRYFTRAFAAHDRCNLNRHGVRGGDRGRAAASKPSLLARHPCYRQRLSQPSRPRKLVSFSAKVARQARGKRERMEARQGKRLGREPRIALHSVRVHCPSSRRCARYARCMRWRCFKRMSAAPFQGFSGLQKKAFRETGFSV